MPVLKVATWNVRYTLPPDVERRFAKNGAATCVCDSIDEAIALVRAEYPTSVVYAVNHKGKEETFFQAEQATLLAAPTGSVEQK